MRKTTHWVHYIDKISEWVGKVASFLILFIVGLIIVSIFTRNTFSYNIFWADEMTQFLFAGLIMLGGAYTLLHGRHVRMDLFYAKLSVRGKAILDLFTFIFFGIYIGMMLWKGWDATWESIRLGERTDSIWGPALWPGKMLILIGAFLVGLQGLAKFIRDLNTARGGKSNG